MAAAEARRDLIRKLELEKKLMAELNKINNAIIQSTIRKLEAEGVAFDPAEMEENLRNVLNTHYEKTADVFSDQIRVELPDDIAATPAENSLIGESLTAYFATRAIEQAAIITETNQKDVNNAVNAALQTRDEDGQPLPRRDQAREAGVGAARKLKARQQSIATTETQHAAETSKGTEAEVLSGKRPSIVAGSPVAANVTKEWVTVGDERVRAAHVAADSQTRDLSKPFTVDGQLLRWPGDTALGASMGNVINCRCSSVYDVKAIFAIRRKRNQQPFTETEPTEQLLESLG